MYEFYFEGRKPSNAQVLKKINEAMRLQHRIIEISWGENLVRLERMPNHFWYGSGCIKNISGADIAHKINDTVEKQFINNHFQFVKVGF